VTSLVRTAAAILADLGQPATPQPTKVPAIIRWETPPPRKSGGPRRLGPDESKYGPLAAQLRSRPRRWALVFAGGKTPAAALYTMIVRGQVPAFADDGRYEAVKRTVDRQARVYARFIGDEG